LYLYYLPAYSPELNRIQILWKQAKYFWRRNISLKGTALLEEVQFQGDGDSARVQRCISDLVGKWLVEISLVRSGCL
jgi:transposase